MTVSRALHQPDKVAEATRRKVADAVLETGYVPNRLGRSLVTNRTQVIAAIVPSIQNPVFAEIVRAMSENLRQAGYLLLLGNSEGHPDQEEALVRTFLAQRPDGVVLHGTTHTPGTRTLLRRSAIPVVETGNLEGETIDVVVGYSNFAAAREMTLHLVSQGYRRIGLICNYTRFSDRATARRRGFLDALEKAGLPAGDEVVEETSYGVREGAEAFARLLGRAPDLDAVFCAGDMWAVGSLFECERRGWPVPERMALAGFDDLPIASEIVPALTTVRVPRQVIGQEAARLLLDRLRARVAGGAIVDVGFEIVRRESA